MILDPDEKFDRLLVTLDHNAPPLSENLVLRYFFSLHWRCRRCAAAVPPRVLEHAVSSSPITPLTVRKAFFSSESCRKPRAMPGEFDSNEVQLATHLAQLSPKSPPSTSPTAALASSRATKNIRGNRQDVVIEVDAAAVSGATSWERFRCIINCEA